MEVAYFTMGDMQLYVNLDRLLGMGAKASLPPYKIIGGGPAPLPRVPAPMP